MIRVGYRETHRLPGAEGGGNAGLGFNGHVLLRLTHALVAGKIELGSCIHRHDYRQLETNEERRRVGRA